MTYYRGPLTIDDIRGIILRVRAGDSYADVAARYHVSKQTITKYMRNADKYVAPPRRRQSLAWQDQAKCLNRTNSEGKWFTEWPVDEQTKVCRDCPVRLECLRWGLRDPAGLEGWKRGTGPVFGGIPPQQAAKLAKAS